jgi:hypothetical protein
MPRAVKGVTFPETEKRFKLCDGDTMLREGLNEHFGMVIFTGNVKGFQYVKSGKKGVSELHIGSNSGLMQSGKKSSDCAEKSSDSSSDKGSGNSVHDELSPFWCFVFAALPGSCFGLLALLVSGAPIPVVSKVTNYIRYDGNPPRFNGVTWVRDNSLLTG